MSEIYFALIAGVVSGLTGLATLLRGRRELTRRNVVSATLHQTLLGLAIAGLWIHYRPGEYWLALSASILIGLSGMKAKEKLIQLLTEKLE